MDYETPVAALIPLESVVRSSGQNTNGGPIELPMIPG